MMINEAMKKYRLPNPTTTEDLEMRFSGMDGKTLTFGDKVLLAGYYYNGRNKPCLLYTSPSPRDTERSRMPSSA